MDKQTLQSLTSNPLVTEAQREKAAEALRGMEERPNNLESELLRQCGAKSLKDVCYTDIHQFCAEHSWSQEAKALYFDRWLPTYTNETEEGAEQLGRVREYLVRDDYDSLIRAAREWKESGFAPDKLCVVQQCARKFVDDEFGIYPAEFVELGNTILLARPERK
jgi:hypothetical protein